MSDNILGEAQREHSGAITYDKYQYQYHWAFCEILDRHAAKQDYALFIEYHEDVVIADSLDVNSARFDFYQVKNIGKPRFNEDNLTKRDGNKNSVLGKLLLSCLNKKYSSRINTIGLTASCGFNLPITDEKLKLSVITTGDLSKSCLDNLNAKVLKELPSSSLPKNIKFIVPKIQIETQQKYVIASISELIEKLFPDSHCRPASIYRTLLDEMSRKGSNTDDFTSWDLLLSHKALTSDGVNSVLAQHMVQNTLEKLDHELISIASELGWPYLKKRTMSKELKSVAIRKTGFPTALELDRSREIKKILNSEQFEKLPDLASVIECCIDSMNQKFADSFSTENERLASVIYEIING